MAWGSESVPKHSKGVGWGAPPKNDLPKKEPQLQHYDGLDLLKQLREEGWTDDDFKRLAAPECTQLRDFARTNVQSRNENDKP